MPDAELPPLPEPETVTIDGLAVSLYGRPAGIPIILSPGLDGHGAYWRPQVRALMNRYRVILYDHRGTGGSDHADLPEPYSVSHMAGDIAAILDGLDYEAAHIVGHAAGALAGLQLALDAPERVLSVAAINGWAATEPYTARCLDIYMAIYRAGGPEAWLRAQPMALFPAEWIADHLDDLDALAAHQAAGFPSAQVLAARIQALSDFDIRERLGDIACPVLVMGSLDDMLVPVRASANLAEGLSNPQFVAVPWGGHAVNVTVPEEFDRYLLTFLREL
ncbi:pyrimidine utilization protein D [Asticcacaulis solisilvae]|uniref:pyrimidine utilization protein D n=1 Tax=Asticcacaulis solisilvae TaxID=1217274 RepID=UPI003FD70B75